MLLATLTATSKYPPLNKVLFYDRLGWVHHIRLLKVRYSVYIRIILAKLGSDKFLASKILWAQNYFWISKKCSVQKNFGSKTTGSENASPVWNFFWVLNKFLVWKFFESVKNILEKNILVQISFAKTVEPPNFGYTNFRVNQGRATEDFEKCQWVSVMGLRNVSQSP